jgi:diguanylate cyclase
VRASAVPVGATVGIAYCPEDAEDGPALLAAADAAMYAAKRKGKNTYCSAGA